MDRAPWLDGEAGRKLNLAGLAGVRFVPAQVTPSSSVHAKKECSGVQIIIDDWAKFNPLRTGLTIAVSLWDLFPEQWDTKNFDRLLVHKASFEAFRAGKSVGEIEKAWATDLKSFRDRRKAYLLYNE